MGFLSKILGDKAEKEALGFLGGLVNEVSKVKQSDENTAVSTPQNKQSQANNDPVTSGFSWGSVMPQEENQYSFNGPYHEYFYQVFSDEYPEYDIKKEVIERRNATVFTFTKDAVTVLVVEVISQSGDPWKIRSDCFEQGIAYLRFYHNHHGWWNTRKYVVSRVNSALEK